MDEDPKSISYLSAEDIRDIHELIVESNAETPAGVASPGDIEYTVGHIREGHFGQVPESLHEKAFQLLRLIAANYQFVDGNKRTALMSTRIFYRDSRQSASGSSPEAVHEYTQSRWRRNTGR
jgi:death-on-curing family protein